MRCPAISQVLPFKVGRRYEYGVFWDYWGFGKAAKKQVPNKTQSLGSQKQAPGGVFWVGVKNGGSDTSTTAAVFLLAIVYK